MFISPLFFPKCCVFLVAFFPLLSYCRSPFICTLKGICTFSIRLLVAWMFLFLVHPCCKNRCVLKMWGPGCFFWITFYNLYQWINLVWRPLYLIFKVIPNVKLKVFSCASQWKPAKSFQCIKHHKHAKQWKLISQSVWCQLCIYCILYAEKNQAFL